MRSLQDIVPTCEAGRQEADSGARCCRYPLGCLHEASHGIYGSSYPHGFVCLHRCPCQSAQHLADANSAVYPEQSGYVLANGVFIYYTSFGKGDPLVVVHGGPGADHTYFLPYLAPLARTHRLIFIDERGSGRSQKLQDVSQYTVENMVEDLEGVRVALNLGKISLLGHSYGGVLAQAYALKYQQNLSHLILNSTFPRPNR